MGRVKLEDSTLIWNLQHASARISAAVNATMHYEAPQAEAWMKQNAPWTDRTSNARNGLATTVVRDRRNSSAIILYHQVPYGPFLEVRKNPDHARPIIVPALAEFGPRVMASFAGLMDKLGGAL